MCKYLHWYFVCLKGVSLSLPVNTRKWLFSSNNWFSPLSDGQNITLQISLFFRESIRVNLLWCERCFLSICTEGGSLVMCFWAFYYFMLTHQGLQYFLCSLAQIPWSHFSGIQELKKQKLYFCYLTFSITYLSCLFFKNCFSINGVLKHKLMACLWV